MSINTLKKSEYSNEMKLVKSILGEEFEYEWVLKNYIAFKAGHKNGKVKMVFYPHTTKIAKRVSIGVRDEHSKDKRSFIESLQKLIFSWDERNHEIKDIYVKKFYSKDYCVYAEVAKCLNS